MVDNTLGTSVPLSRSDLSRINPLIDNSPMPADTVVNISAALEFLADAVELFESETQPYAQNSPRGCAMLIRVCCAELWRQGGDSRDGVSASLIAYCTGSEATQ